MNLAPFLTIKHSLKKFLTLQPSAEQLLELQNIYRLYSDLDLNSMYAFYNRSHYINENYYVPTISCPIAEFELELFTYFLIARLTSKAKANIKLYQAKLDELTERIHKQLKSINQLIADVNNPDKLRLYYHIPSNWLHAQEEYEHLFYHKDDDEHYSCFSTHTARDYHKYCHLSTSKHKTDSKLNSDVWATKLIRPEDFI